MVWLLVRPTLWDQKGERVALAVAELNRVTRAVVCVTGLNHPVTPLSVEISTLNPWLAVAGYPARPGSQRAGAGGKGLNLDSRS